MQMPLVSDTDHRNPRPEETPRQTPQPTMTPGASPSHLAKNSSSESENSGKAALVIRG
jgi:hypothetical protein